MLAGGLVIGGLARLAVPGPDPMTWWATLILGVAGAVVGGVVSRVVFGTWGGLVTAPVASVLLLILYRRLVQGRGVTGPEAKVAPTRGWWLPRRPAPRPASVDKLERLRDAGVLSPEEYDEKRAEALADATPREPRAGDGRAGSGGAR